MTDSPRIPPIPPVTSSPLETDETKPSAENKASYSGRTVQKEDGGALIDSQSTSSDQLSPNKPLSERLVAKVEENTYQFTCPVIKAGQLSLEKFSSETADSYMEKIAKLSGDSSTPIEKVMKTQQAFVDAYNEMGVSKENITVITGRFCPGLPQTYDTGVPNTALQQLPSLHSQVAVSDSSGAPARKINANYITYDGHEVGIAMPASTAKDTALMLPLTAQGGGKVFIDLFDHQRNDGPDSAWSVLSDGKEHIQSGYTVKSLSATQDTQTQATLTQFKLTNQLENTSTFSRIHFNDWPDMGVVDPQTMDALHQLIDQEIEHHGDPGKVIINCRAGEGRTGVLFALRYLRDKAKRQELDINALNSEVFSVLLQGKMSRNADFVQSYKQIIFIREEAKRYAEQFSNT